MSEIKEDDFEIDIKREDSFSIDQWRSCCCTTTDPRLLKYVSVYFILASVCVFSMYELHLSEECSDQTTYISLLTFVLGLIVPNH